MKQHKTYKVIPPIRTKHTKETTRLRSIEIPDYEQGRKVKILRGEFKGQIHIICQSSNHWVTVMDLPHKTFNKCNVKYIFESDAGMSDDK